MRPARSESSAVPRRRRKRRGVTALAVGAATGAGVIASRYLTPWPMAMVIRRVFERGGAQAVEQMLPHVPTSGIVATLDRRYAVSVTGSAIDTCLDVFYPDTGTGSETDAGHCALPTVIWIHGGGWIAGDKSDVAPYLKILAAQGYTMVGLNYTRGPAAHYPTAVEQLNSAIGYLAAHAAELRIDPSRIVLAGDSAGAQLASQLAALITNPEYAALVDVHPAIDRDRLKGVILNCGVYDLEMMSRGTGLTGWGFKKTLWAYTGSRDWASTPAGTQMSTLRFVTGDFPPTYISGGNGDRLTAGQSIPMADRLRRLGVQVTSVFFDAEHEPAQPHEYQFALGSSEADDALQATLQFLRGLPSFRS